MNENKENEKPLVTIIILETGEGREVNPIQHPGISPPREDWEAHDIHAGVLEKWQAAESKLRTLPIKNMTFRRGPGMQYYPFLIHFDKEFSTNGLSTAMNCKPGTRWKARLSDDQTAWVIVERVEGKE